ncbi:GntR family transcriptional regulator [Nocardiopsis sp. NPDC055551]
MPSISLITTLSRPAAPYVQIADHYRELIATGSLPPGDRLPTVIQMATAWRVSPGTAHKAVRLLRGEGLVRTTRQGTTVQEEAA